MHDNNFKKATLEMVKKGRVARCVSLGDMLHATRALLVLAVWQSRHIERIIFGINGWFTVSGFAQAGAILHFTIIMKKKMTITLLDPTLFK